MYVGTIWTLRQDSKARDTYLSNLGKLLVQGSRGVIMGAHGFKKVKVTISGNNAHVTAEDVKNYRGGHEVKEWLNGSQSEETIEWGE